MCKWSGGNLYGITCHTRVRTMYVCAGFEVNGGAEKFTHGKFWCVIPKAESIGFLPSLVFEAKKHLKNLNGTPLKKREKCAQRRMN